MTDAVVRRVALITGGGRNIGRAVALALAGQGTDVAINVRTGVQDGESVASAVRALGVDATVVLGDVSDPDQAAPIVAHAIERLGPVDILVHAAGYRPRVMLRDASIAEWHRVMDTNTSSLFYLSRQVLPSMSERCFGRLIAFSGPDATHSTRGHGVVAASKAALVSLIRAVAVEYGTRGITANLVSPTLTETTVHSMTPEFIAQRFAIPRAGLHAEIAQACAFLASDRAAYITGENLHVDGGFSL